MIAVETEDKKTIEKANSYRQMMDQWAWKDFKGIMDQRRNDALEKTIWASTMEEVQVQRGYVKCIDSLNSEIDYILGALDKSQ